MSLWILDDLVHDSYSFLDVMLVLRLLCNLIRHRLIDEESNKGICNGRVAPVTTEFL